MRDDATVVAIGSHEPGAREVDEPLVARATVVVESRASALREAGDVIAAIDAGALGAGDLHGLAELVRGEVAPAAGRPRLFKSTGMAWEDLVLARAVHARGLSGGVPLKACPSPWSSAATSAAARPTRRRAPPSCASCSTSATASTSTPSPAAGSRGTAAASTARRATPAATTAAS